MINILVSGEGNSDVGEVDQYGNFTKGPITILTEKILNWNYKYEIHFRYIPRVQLKKFPVTLKGRKKKDRLGGSSKGHANLAYKLAVNAIDTKCDIAILMRDADKRNFSEVYSEIKDGFKEAKYSNGIPSVPTPCSEAWIICAFDPSNNSSIESSGEDMKLFLAKILAENGKVNNKETLIDISKSCSIESVNPPSFKMFKDDIKNVVRYI